MIENFSEIGLWFKWCIFFLTAIAAIFSSLMMVTKKNAIHSALWLIVTFCSVAVLYILLNATFIALAQIMIYAGAIMMLVIFVIMLIHLEQEDQLDAKRSFAKLIGAIITVTLFIQMLAGFLAFRGSGKMGPYSPTAQNASNHVAAVGSVLYGKYAFAFEIASILLLIGIIGAVILAKKRKD